MISGVITSKENGEKLVGVNIYINELQKVQFQIQTVNTNLAIFH